MSISNTVTKVEEFEYDNASTEGIANNELEKHPTEPKQQHAKNSTRAARA